MSKKYRPSNGTEGVCFMEKHCFNCIHERFSHTQNHADKMCEIMSDTMIYNVDDPEYPEQWTYNEQGYPTCTAWVKWDWDNDGNPDDPDNPKCRPPEDPDQLCLPFELDAIQPEIEVKPQLQTT